MTDQQIILAGVGVYLLVMISIGVISARRASAQAADFMLAGRTLPLWLCTATIMATWLGGGSMLGVSGQTYEGGLLDVIADPFGAALGIFLVGLFVIRLVRRLQLVTVIDFFLMRFGRPATIVAAFAIVLSGVAWAGALMVAFGTILNVLTGVPLVWGILIGGLIVVGYTAIGGMWAVAMTDLIQLIVMILGLVILTTIVVLDMGGVSAAWSQIPAEKLNLLPLENDAPSWLNYLRAWFIIGVSNLASQSLLQRGLAAKDERTAQWAYYFGAVGFLIIGLIPALLGILASVTMPGVEDKQTLLPLLAEAHLHPLLMALFVGAVLAAIMSSADSALLAASSVISMNLLPLLQPAASEAQKLRWARFSIPICGLVAGGTALQFQAIYDLIVEANAVLLAAVVVPFVLGIWWQKTNRVGVQAGMAAALVTWLTVSFIAPDLPGDLVGMFVCLVVTIGVALATQASDPPAPITTPDGQPVALTDRLGVQALR
ncbi:MAG: sodium:solute symporter family protein [Pseudomonadota bacterium]